MVIENQLPRLSAALGGKKTVKVLMVCLGNICRSPAAEGVLREIVEQGGDYAAWEIDSAGTGNYHIGDLPDRRMLAHARRRGLSLTHRCRQVHESDFDRFDLIFAMDESNRRNLLALAPTPEAQTKVFPISGFFTLATRWDHVPDPYYEGSEGFELVLDLLGDACLNIYNTVEKARNNPPSQDVIR